MVENTCKRSECYMAQVLGDYRKCFNFRETAWATAPREGGETRIVEDCAPVRSMLMIQELYARLVGVQQSQEQMRNRFAWLEGVVEKRKRSLRDHDSGTLERVNDVTSGLSKI